MILFFGEAMKERPIIFSTPMIQAILEGRKTQTRRVVKYRPYAQDDAPVHLHECPYGVPGDRLWVREAWGQGYFTPPGDDTTEGAIHYRATELDAHVTWKPSIFMPRWASRITLRITKVRVERVQNITGKDAIAEGVESVDQYRKLWNSLNAKRDYGWDENPRVWVIEFRRVNS